MGERTKVQSHRMRISKVESWLGKSMFTVWRKKARDDQERIAVYTKRGQKRRVMSVHDKDGLRYFK